MTRDDEWRQRYLHCIAVQLALVEYLATPDATTDGAFLILTGQDLERTP